MCKSRTPLPLLEAIQQCNHKRRLIPEEIRFLIRPINALGAQGDVIVVQQFADDQTDLTVSQSRRNKYQLEMTQILLRNSGNKLTSSLDNFSAQDSTAARRLSYRRRSGRQFGATAPEGTHWAEQGGGRVVGSVMVTAHYSLVKALAHKPAISETCRLCAVCTTYCLRQKLAINSCSIGLDNARETGHEWWVHAK